MAPPTRARRWLPAVGGPQSHSVSIAKPPRRWCSRVQHRACRARPSPRDPRPHAWRGQASKPHRPGVLRCREPVDPCRGRRSWPGPTRDARGPRRLAPSARGPLLSSARDVQHLARLGGARGRAPCLAGPWAASREPRPASHGHGHAICLRLLCSTGRPSAKPCRQKQDPADSRRKIPTSEEEPSAYAPSVHHPLVPVGLLGRR